MQFGTDKEHTMGPLQVHSEAQIDGEYQPNDKGWPFVVCKPSDAIGTSDYHTAIGIQSKADAYLYAAAPAMLDALRAVIANPHAALAMARSLHSCSPWQSNSSTLGVGRTEPWPQVR